MTHEDERRTLTSVTYKDGEIKIIIAKKHCELGNHYHKVKTERFTLISGFSSMVLNDVVHILEIGKEVVVSPSEKHSFELEEGSILFCICSHPYDKNDDYE